MAHYTGTSSGKAYTLGSKLAEGGEGTVYELSGDTGHVAKIYKTTRFKTEDERDTLERKLKAMLSMNIKANVDGLLRLAWPQDILYENGQMVGFVMPRINTNYKIFHVYRTGPGSVRESEYNGNYTWKYSAQFAYNMAWVVDYLHRNNIVVGDLNQNNIAVDTKTGAVILIDCDSFDIRDPRTGEHFPCVVALPEILAPELQTVGTLKNGTFTKESDNFSLAIHIFRLLMNNEDPFGGRITSDASQSSIPGNKAIINGECLYVRDVAGKEWLPRMPKLTIMPPSIQNLFRRTFNYTATTAKVRANNRATADEWMQELAILGAPEPNPNLKTCADNSKHVYPAHNATCPWCDIDKAIRNRMPTHINPNQNNQSSQNTQKTGSSSSSGSSSTSSTSTRTTSTSYTPPTYTSVKRKATAFYAVLIILGLASGLLFGEWVSSVFYDLLDFRITAGTCSVILSILGLISGVALAHSFEDKYIRADAAFPWFAMGLLAMVLPLAVAAILGLAAVLVIAVFYLACAALGVVCVFSMCCSS